MNFRIPKVSLPARLLLLAVVMFGFAYALVPLYKAFCDATGVNVLAVGDRDIAEAKSELAANTQVDLSRVVTVEFDANVRGPWDFKPAVSHVDVHPGELTTVMYNFQNLQERSITAQAIPSYAPQEAGPNFHKIECFCFQQYTLAPGEKKAWPVVFVVDPKLSRDVRTITLSYTFFEIGGKTPMPPTAQAIPVVVPGARS